MLSTAQQLHCAQISLGLAYPYEICLGYFSLFFILVKLLVCDFGHNDDNLIKKGYRWAIPKYTFICTIGLDVAAQNRWCVLGLFIKDVKHGRAFNMS